MLNRREFLRNAGAAGLALAGTPLLAQTRASRPNILLITTDQSRWPVWFPPGVASLTPARNRLRKQGVSFDQFYANAIPCSPNRACMMSGLYGHQQWMIDNAQLESTLLLDPAFPTYGSVVRERGYSTFYFGKWHLTNRSLWHGVEPEAALQPYGFDIWRPQDGQVARDYEGQVNEGCMEDEFLTDTVVQWLGSPEADQIPWLAVASLINPHDISWYPNGPAGLIAQLKRDGEWVDYGVSLPANYESLDQLAANKPACQAQHVRASAEIVGEITNISGTRSWMELLNFYLWLEARVDVQIGRILAALDARPRLRANTVVIYVSDHGEQAGSHGIEGKVCGSYQEQNHLRCTFTDYTGRFVPPSQVGTGRSGFAQSIDLVPSIMGLAGVPASDYPYLPGTNLVPSLADPDFPLAPFVLSTVDFFLYEAPSHTLHYHDARWKISMYNHWLPGTTTPDPEQEEGELYDLTTRNGRLEMDNIAATAPEFQQLRDDLVDFYSNEMLAAPLPAPLDEAQAAARQRYIDAHADGST